VHYAALYNQQEANYAIELTFTPKWRKAADIAPTVVTIPADARYTDMSGTGAESIAPTDPSQRNGQPWFLFYRRDIFAAAKLPRPETMDDVLNAARQLNGTDFNGDGAPDYSVCFNPAVSCVANYFTFLGILGPMLQTAPSAGVFFQPETMEPLVQNAAMVQALGMFANLSRYNYPDANLTCGPFSPQFAAGTCSC
jgi:ABC-type glycerol-3-phosphate transport system substrate-binding protein